MKSTQYTRHLVPFPVERVLPNAGCFYRLGMGTCFASSVDGHINFLVGNELEEGIVPHCFGHLNILSSTYSFLFRYEDRI
jgi:hypothetical protein